MSFELPSLDPELKNELDIIIKNKTFDSSASKLTWETGILPKLIARLDELCQLSKHGDRFGKPKDIDLPESINRNNKTIKKHLASKMCSSPPFTIYRIAEMILDPNNQGYNIIDNDQLFKYFNSLKKVFVVSSAVDEFPPVEISEEGKEKECRPLARAANNLSLVEIPWLKKKQPNTDNEEESLATATTTITVTATPIDGDHSSTQKRKDPETTTKESGSNKKVKTELSN